MNFLMSCMTNTDISGSTRGTLLKYIFMLWSSYYIFLFKGISVLRYLKYFVANNVIDIKLILIQYYLYS